MNHQQIINIIKNSKFCKIIGWETVFFVVFIIKLIIFGNVWYNLLALNVMFALVIFDRWKLTNQIERLNKKIN